MFSTINHNVTVGDRGAGVDRVAWAQSIKRSYARLDMSILAAFRNVPFRPDHDVSIHFTLALRNAVEIVRLTCDDTHTVGWTRGWKKVLGHQVLRSVRSSFPHAPAMKTLVADAFAQGGNLLDAGQSGKGAFNHTLCALRRGFVRVSSAAVMQTPQNLVVGCAGKISQEFLSELRLLASNGGGVWAGQSPKMGRCNSPTRRASVINLHLSARVFLPTGTCDRFRFQTETNY